MILILKLQIFDELSYPFKIGDLVKSKTKTNMYRVTKIVDRNHIDVKYIGTLYIQSMTILGPGLNKDTFYNQSLQFFDEKTYNHCQVS